MSSPSQPTAPSGQALLTIPGLGWLLAAVALAFAAFSIMLPIAPLAVLDAGGSKVVAGVATTAFMVVTVLTQLATATLISRFGYRRVMLVATAFLSMPALIQVFVTDPWGIVAISALRGIGFGTVCVTQYALVAKLVPEGMFGRASGAIGVAAGFAQMATLPLGVIVITTAAGFHGAYLITAIVGLAGLAVCFFVPEPAQTRRAPQTRTREEPTSQPGQQKERDHRGGLIKLFALPACALASVSMSYGAISSFLPDTAAAMDPTVGAMLAGIMLSVIGGAQMVARYAAGGHRRSWAKGGRAVATRAHPHRNGYGWHWPRRGCEWLGVVVSGAGVSVWHRIWCGAKRDHAGDVCSRPQRTHRAGVDGVECVLRFRHGVGVGVVRLGCDHRFDQRCLLRGGRGYPCGHGGSDYRRASRWTPQYNRVGRHRKNDSAGVAEACSEAWL